MEWSSQRLKSFTRGVSNRLDRTDSPSSVPLTVGKSLQVAQMPPKRADSTFSKFNHRASTHLEPTESSLPEPLITQNNIQSTAGSQAGSQRAETSQTRARPPPLEAKGATHLPQKPHEALATFYSASTREGIADEDSAEESEDVSNVSLLELQHKYQQLKRRLEKTDGQCSALVEEVIGLRAKNLFDDDTTLRDSFKTLDFSVRSWCIRLRETKAVADRPMSLTYPVAADRASYSFLAPADELYFLKSGLWAWLIKLVFDGAIDMATEDPDLWTQELCSIAMRYLERLFVTQGKILESRTSHHGLKLPDPRGAQQWRCLTVRMLAQCSSETDAKRTRRVIKKIMNWAMEGADITKDKSVQDELASRLGSEVVDKAVKLSLEMRRQYNICRVRFPGESDPQFTPADVAAALPGAKTDSKTSQNTPDRGTIRIFPKPCLEKHEPLHSTSSNHDPIVLVKCDCVELKIDRTSATGERGPSVAGKHSAFQDRHPQQCVVM